VARWVEDGWEKLEALGRLFNTLVVKDNWGRPVLLFRNEWNVNQLLQDHPSLTLKTIAPVVSGQEPITFA
jgi:peptide chain release factor 3